MKAALYAERITTHGLTRVLFAPRPVPIIIGSYLDGKTTQRTGMCAVQVQQTFLSAEK